MKWMNSVHDILTNSSSTSIFIGYGNSGKMTDATLNRHTFTPPHWDPADAVNFLSAFDPNAKEPTYNHHFPGAKWFGWDPRHLELFDAYCNETFKVEGLCSMPYALSDDQVAEMIDYFKDPKYEVVRDGAVRGSTLCLACTLCLAADNWHFWRQTFVPPPSELQRLARRVCVCLTHPPPLAHADFQLRTVGRPVRPDVARRAAPSTQLAGQHQDSMGRGQQPAVASMRMGRGAARQIRHGEHAARLCART